MVAIASLLATSLVAFVGTSESRGATGDDDISPDLSFLSITPSGGTTETLAAPYDVAFDSAGNLWVANNKEGTDDIVMYDLSQQGASGDQSVPPIATLNVNGLPPAPDGPGIYSLDFVQYTGDLWISTESQGLIRIKSSDLPPSGQVNVDLDCRITGDNTRLNPAQLGTPKQVAVHPDNADRIFVANAGVNSNLQNDLLIFDASLCELNPTDTNVAPLATQPLFAGPAGTSGETTPSSPYGVAIDPDSVYSSDTTYWVGTATGTLQKYTVNLPSLSGTINPLSAGFIYGPSTELDEPHGIAIHPTTKSIWASNPNQQNPGPPSFPAGSITEYLDVTGNAEIAPHRRIIGPNTDLADPSGLGFNPSDNNALWVANSDELTSQGNSVRRYGDAPTPTNYTF